MLVGFMVSLHLLGNNHHFSLREFECFKRSNNQSYLFDLKKINFIGYLIIEVIGLLGKEK